MAITDLARPDATRRGPTCGVCALLETLPPDEAAALTRLLSDPTWRYSELSIALRNEGHDLPEFVLSRHARGGCAARKKLR